MFSTLEAMSGKILPMVTNAASKIAPGLLNSTVEALSELGVKSILGSGCKYNNQTAGFMVLITFV